MTEYRSPNFPALFIDDQNKLRGFDLKLISALGDWDFLLRAILQGGGSFTDNMNVSIVDFVSSSTPNNENTISHRLGKIPIGYFVIGKDKPTDVYTGTTAWTSSNAYLKCDASSAAVNIMFF